MYRYSKDLDLKIASKEAFHALLKESKNGLRQSKAITFVNPFSYPLLADSKSLITEIDVVFSDGVLHTKLHNYFNNNLTERMSFDFSSLAGDVLDFASLNKLKVAFIGAKPGVVDVAVENYKKMYNGLDVVFMHHGYLKDAHVKAQVLKELSIVNADIVICGMGTPLQDKFIVELKSTLTHPALLFTCGGFIEQSSIKADYYHPVIKKLGLRWLQRAVMHKHVRDRLFKEYPLFVVSYIRTQFKSASRQRVKS